MTKGSHIYEGLQIHNWVKTQDFATKFSKLSKKRQAAFEALAVELDSNKILDEPAAPPQPENPVPVQKKKKTVTAYTLFKKELDAARKHLNESKLTADEVRLRFNALNAFRILKYQLAADNLPAVVKKHKITAYTLFKKKLIQHRKENNESELPPVEVRMRFKALEPDRLQLWEQAAIKRNEELGKK